jgi:hypothetical protein
MSLRLPILIGLAGLPLLGAAQEETRALEERVQDIETHQQELERELADRDRRIAELEAENEAGQDVPRRPTYEEVIAATTKDVDTGAPMALGRGFVLGEGDYGRVALGVYALARATVQEPAEQTAIDHLGREFAVDTRRDVQLHRVMIHLRGWFLDPKFNYQLTTWTVNDTEQVRVIGALTYQFNDAIALSAGIGPMPSSRSMLGSHPLWLGHDRVMADEYFRTGFTSGIWVDGKISPTLTYKVTVGNNISSLGVNASEDTRDLAYGAGLTWQPTTGEFGPQGGFGDFEMHEELATRFGIGHTRSPKEDRAAQPSQNAPDTTQIRLGDSLLLFQLGALGDGVGVQKAGFDVYAMDAGFKYKGFFVQAEIYRRLLNDFQPTELSLPIPVESIRDTGYYVQGSFFPLPRKLELYAATSQVVPDNDVGFKDSSEFLVGMNWYWKGMRYQRLNVQLIDVKDSPASSTFGYYTGGMDGRTLTVDVSMLF